MGTSSFKGYRVLSVKLNSPFDTKVEPYFDFIVDFVPQQSPKDILDRLSPPEHKDPLAGMMQKVRQNVGKPVKFKVFSTKDQKLRDIQIKPDNSWGGAEDFLGIEFRLEDPNTCQQNYCRISDVQMGSPAYKAKLANGDYLLGCEELKYQSLQELIDNMHQILYSKEIANKSVTLVSYNANTDRIQWHRVELQRKWGGKGLLGCEFLDGHLYRLPDNLEQIRTQYKAKMAYRSETQCIQKELMSSDGAGKRLAENLKKKVLRREIHFKVPSPDVSRLQSSLSDKQQPDVEPDVVKQNSSTDQKYILLEERVRNLQAFISQLQGSILKQENLQENCVQH